MAYADLRPIVELVPKYAHSRRAGWEPASACPAPLGVAEYLLLRRIAIEREHGPVSVAELDHLRNPYATIDHSLDALPRLLELRVLSRSVAGYEPTSVGRATLQLGEQAANDATALRLSELSLDDLGRLASILHDIGEHQRLAPEPAHKSHQRLTPQLRALDPRETPPVVLEYALYALQRARDDAHIAAWRAAGFSGPDLAIVDALRESGSTTSAKLAERMRGSMHAEDVTMLVASLTRAGYVRRRASDLVLTDEARGVRDAIERETDRLYFAPWPDVDARWLVEQLERVVATIRGK
jgi:DNA-binding MarR family transcriptional regulator